MSLGSQHTNSVLQNTLQHPQASPLLAPLVHRIALPPLSFFFFFSLFLLLFSFLSYKLFSFFFSVLFLSLELSSFFPLQRLLLHILHLLQSTEYNIRQIQYPYTTYYTPYSIYYPLYFYSTFTVFLHLYIAYTLLFQ